MWCSSKMDGPAPSRASKPLQRVLRWSSNLHRCGAMPDRVVEGEVRNTMHRPNGSCARRDFWIPASAVVLTLLLCPGVYARQSPPRFEVATVKLSLPPSDPTG